MVVSNEVNVELSLAFPRAGVAFAVGAQTHEGNGTRSSFRVSVTDVSSGRDVPLRLDASPQLADWVRGYSRWLVRANVTASYDESSISGTFGPGLSPEQVLRGVQDACDMIRQRFEGYEESVLT